MLHGSGTLQKEIFKQLITNTCKIEKFDSDNPSVNYALLQNILKFSLETYLSFKLVKYSKHKHKGWISPFIYNLDLSLTQVCLNQI